ncbi:MAG: 2-amino-4-hydroxy-6-hydroxymethyldihydropteridine diphosphokinase [Marinobacter sp.]|nr:2-amino-4-hydroxy-6-hydroxymethyldihydropteridine diphosphokinase [Marinobacter sp.]
MTVRVYISIGSNVDRERHVTVALNALADAFGDLQLSSVYESEAVGFAGSPFYNLVAGIDTALPVGVLAREFKALELRHGRLPGALKFSPRTLDLDILLYGDQVGEVDGVELPRAEILTNAFVLQPMAEIAPGLCHPVCGETYEALWQAYNTPQRLWPVSFLWRGRQLSAGFAHSS